MISTSFPINLQQMHQKKSKSSHIEQSTSLCDTKFKLVFLGDMGVGKTSIIDRFISDEFDLNNNPTVGIDFLSRNFTVNNSTFRLQLWDTAGQEKYKSLVPAYLRDANAAVFVYDVSRRESLENLKNWIQLYRENQSQDSCTCIVASKVDLLQAENPLKQEAQRLASTQETLYLQVSAKTGQGVIRLFTEIVSRLSSKGKQTPQQLQAQKVIVKLGSATENHTNCCYI